MEKDGAFYLFSLRLAPNFPFFLINLLMGLTSIKIKIKTFFWVSQLGMLLGTAVYVNAGSKLATITSLKGIMTPTIMMSLALLGLLPLISRFALKKVMA